MVPKRFAIRCIEVLYFLQVVISCDVLISINTTTLHIQRFFVLVDILHSKFADLLKFAWSVVC